MHQLFLSWETFLRFHECGSLISLYVPIVLDYGPKADSFATKILEKTLNIYSLKYKINIFYSKKKVSFLQNTWTNFIWDHLFVLLSILSLLVF